jgi:hypothetical protein
MGRRRVNAFPLPHQTRHGTTQGRKAGA